jgi:hypothetical protein
MIESMGALAVDRGLECRPAWMTDVRGRHTRTKAPGVDPAGVAAVEMWRRVGGKTGATHTHGATAEMGSAATHAHGAATTAKMSSATPTAEVSAATAAAPEVSAATASAAKMSTATATATATATETAASCVSSRRQTKGNRYCGRACRDFPHDTPRQGHMRQANARSPGPFQRDAAMHTCALRA